MAGFCHFQAGAITEVFSEVLKCSRVSAKA